jgi:hypothetical protein
MDEATRSTDESSGPPLTEEFPMGDQHQPLGPYDPTDDDIAAARRTLDRHIDEYGLRDCESWVLGWISAALDNADARPERAVRDSRAMFAAFRARRAVES